jgi:hypothetical protein
MTQPNGKGDRRFHKGATADMVAVILAIGVVLALNIVTGAILWAAYQRLGIDPDSGISENGTQLLTGAFGGIIGVLGSYIGFRYGEKKGSNGEKPPPPEKPTETP